MDRFDAMQAYARVVETASFTRAAETLNISRASVTQLVQQLEARLRVKLLHRTTRKVKVTADGAAYYERVVRLLADMDDAETSLSSAAAAPRGRLRVDVPSPFARFILMPALPAFHARHPDIQLHMGVSDRKVDLIDDNVDCVVRGGEVADQSLVARRVGELTIQAYAAPAYLEAAGEPQDPRDLDADPHRYVAYLRSRAGDIVPLILHRGADTVQVQGRYVVAADDGNAYLAAGLAGLGVLWLPTYMAEPYRAGGELVQVLPDWRIDPMPMYVAYPPNRHVSAKVRVFIDWVIELMAQHAPLLTPLGSARIVPSEPRGRGRSSPVTRGSPENPA